MSECSVPHEDPNQTDITCHFLDEPVPSWDPHSARRAIILICFIALAWAALKKGAFFLPAGAPRPPTPAWGSLGISGNACLQRSDLCPQLQPPTSAGSQAWLFSTLFVPLFPAACLGTTHDGETAIPCGLARFQILNTSKDL